MIPYFILIVWPLLIRLVADKYRFVFGKRIVFQTRSASIDAFMLVFLLLLALRGIECGVDTRQYLRLFNRYSAQSFVGLVSSQTHELGYRLLNKLVGTVGGNYQLLLVITAVICVWPLWYFYKRESDKPLLTIALFLTVAPFAMYFSGIRQAMAMSMGVAAWYCTRNKKLWSFIAVVLLAIQFHTSAFILFALYPLYYANITKRWLWFVMPCMLLVYVFKTQIFNFLLVFMWKEYSAITETGATTVLMLLVVFGIYSYIIPDEKIMDKDTIAMRNILLCTITIQFFAMLHPLAMRMNYYFLIYIPALIPRIAGSSKTKYKQIAKLSVVVMTTFFLFYFINNGIRGSDDLNIFPYVPFWNS